MIPDFTHYNENKVLPIDWKDLQACSYGAVCGQFWRASFIDGTPTVMAFMRSTGHTFTD